MEDIYYDWRLFFDGKQLVTFWKENTVGLMLGTGETHRCFDTDPSFSEALVFFPLNCTFIVLLHLETGNFKNFTPIYKSTYICTSQVQPTTVSEE